jgi:hypothetical protein
VSNDYIGAMPRLYGAPAYARPPRVLVIDRPLDPDDLPLEAHRTPADQALLAEILDSPRDPGIRDEGGSLLRRALLPFGRHEGRRPESKG